MTLYDIAITTIVICLWAILLILIVIFCSLDDMRLEVLTDLHEIRNELRKLNKKRGKK